MIIEEAIEKAIETGKVFDKEEIYHNCTVQVLTNTKTGEVSVGWWQEHDKRGLN